MIDIGFDIRICNEHRILLLTLPPSGGSERSAKALAFSSEQAGMSEAQKRLKAVSASE